MELGGSLLDRSVFGVPQEVDTCGRLRGGMGYSSDVCRRYVHVSLTLIERATDHALQAGEGSSVTALPFPLMARPM